MPDNVIKSGIVKLYPSLVDGREIWAQPEPPDATVWALCPYLRGSGHKCMHCPAWEDDDDDLKEFGPVKRGCRALAEEAVKVVTAMQAREASMRSL